MGDKTIQIYLVMMRWDWVSIKTQRHQGRTSRDDGHRDKSTVTVSAKDCQVLMTTTKSFMEAGKAGSLGGSVS